MDRIAASDPRWKTAAITDMAKNKLLAKLQQVIDYAPYRGATRLEEDIARVFHEFVESMRELGYQVELNGSTGGPAADTLTRRGPAWSIITLPLLGAMEAGIKEHLADAIQDTIEREMRFTETASVFRVFGQDVAEEMENYVQNHTSGTSAKPVVDVDEDDVKVTLKVEEGVVSDNQYVEIERVLDGLSKAFARKHDLKMHSYGTDYYGGQMAYTVRFKDDD
jgi:hypothetical protein